MLETLGFAAGSAWLSGINLYAAALTLGILQRTGLAHLPGDLGFLAHGWVIALSAILYAVEFAADKIPVVDSVWDTVHTFIRIPAGAILAASAFAHFSPGVRLVAMLVGGGIALSSHGAKAATRVAANTSPEPFSNIALSLFEDVIAFGSTALMAFHPVIILGVVIVFLIFAIWLLPKIFRALRGLFRGGSRVLARATGSGIP